MVSMSMTVMSLKPTGKRHHIRLITILVTPVVRRWEN
jgi:hypothetical protein